MFYLEQNNRRIWQASTVAEILTQWAPVPGDHSWRITNDAGNAVLDGSSFEKPVPAAPRQKSPSPWLKPKSPEAPVA